MALASNSSIISSAADVSVLRDKDLPNVSRRRQLLSGFQRGCKRLVRYWWAWELLAASLSIVSTAALIVVLKESDQKKQQTIRVGKAELTLNAVVAAISTIIRTSLTVTVAGALDQSAWNWFATSRSGTTVSSGKPINDLDIFGGASSDSWSSLRLLWRTRGCALASLGALLVVLSLAFDTFSQQVLSLEIRSAPSLSPSSNTSLPRVSSYTNVFDSDTSVPDKLYSLEGIVTANIFNNNVSMPASPCSSGNCSWPVTPSIGVCSSCIDARRSISKYVHIAETTTGVASSGSAINSSVDILEYSLAWEFSPLGFEPFATNINFEAADYFMNLSFTQAFTVLESGRRANVSILQPGAISGLTPEGKLPIIQFFALGIPLANVESYRALYNETHLTGDKIIDTLFTLFPNDVEPLLTAYNCTFSFCLQGYQAETKDGVAQERLSQSWEIMSQVGEDSVWQFANVPSALNAGNGSSYVIDESSVWILRNAFRPSLIGSVDIDLLMNGTSGMRFINDFGSSEATSGAVMKVFWKASASLSDMNDLCQKIASGLTSWMRTTLPAKADARYASTVISNETLVRVRWPWLTYPLALLVLGHVFLLTTIRRTQRLRVRPWKGHRIPLLLANIDDVVKGAAAGGLHSRTGLEERIGRMKILLEYDDNDSIAFKKV